MCTRTRHGNVDAKQEIEEFRSKRNGSKRQAIKINHISPKQGLRDGIVYEELSLKVQRGTLGPQWQDLSSNIKALLAFSESQYITKPPPLD